MSTKMPTTTYWQRLPIASMILFLMGVFFLFSITGVATDIFDSGRQTTEKFIVSILFAGGTAMVYAVAGFTLRQKFWIAFLPILAAQLFFSTLIARYLHNVPTPTQMDSAAIAALEKRLAVDGYAIIIATVIGYICFLVVNIKEGRRYFRVQAEIELATEVHRILVPPIETRLGVWEFYGRSSPSGEVGGDLIDLAGDANNWVAYVADVSGHGVAPGVVMGMVKSAARMLLTSGDDVSHLAPRLNEVLYPLKKPDMFVTFCFLAKTREGLRLGVSGHPAILHFSARTNEVTQYQASNMPLGILPEGEFASVVVASEPGSLFALYTDGFVECANAAGEEFGIQRLQAEFQKNGNKPLAEIHTALVASLRQHGTQFDDQSLLLVRQLAS
ncbi:MAG TPA: PP2C family protein-serine/threonine phosphatase [Candidatus Sulfotelmatobacter sp.]|nr:PP2C family protein-serine/threonine phosphatase [Candidatus Sulfotelmatobacter sp.]